MPKAVAGLLYLLSCLAKFGDMRAEMEAAGAVDVLLELLSTCHDTKVQVILLSAPAPHKVPHSHEDALHTFLYLPGQGCSAGIDALLCLLHEHTIVSLLGAMSHAASAAHQEQGQAAHRLIRGSSLPGGCAMEVCGGVLTALLLCVQAATLSLLRILTRAGKTLCAAQEQGDSVPSSGSIVPGRASPGSRGAGGSEKRRSLDGPPALREALSACQSLAASGRSQSLCLF